MFIVTLLVVVVMVVVVGLLLLVAVLLMMVVVLVKAGMVMAVMVPLPRTAGACVSMRSLASPRRCMAVAVDAVSVALTPLLKLLLRRLCSIVQQSQHLLQLHRMLHRLVCCCRLWCCGGGIRCPALAALLGGRRL